jgi:hypothetical protein
MIDGGELSVQKVSTGYRWSYVTTGGATFLGPRIHKGRNGKSAARSAGEKWLEEQRERGR